MYTARITGSGFGGLGALPALLVTGILEMVKYKWTQAQIRSQLATEYQEMKKLSEAQLTELALLLGRETNVAEWEWFNLLRSARDMALFANGTPENGEPPPIGPPPPAVSTATWIAIGAATLLALVVSRR